MGTRHTARFTVAFNGDDHLIPSIARLPGVDSVFGKLSQDIVGGGRPTYTLAEVGLGALTKSIQLAHDHGLKFYYLLNAACMGNREFSRATNDEIVLLLDRIVEARADGIVVGMPYLLALAKRRHPNLKVSISTFANIDSPRKARAWEERGADRLILAADVNRDRNTLENIRKSVACELELFANTMCTYQCPFGEVHAACCSHASSSADALKGSGVDYYSYQCAERRLRNPSEFVRGRFLRPEDLGAYEELGIDVFKLSDRLRGTPWIIRAAKAYSSRRYDGNLADIISYPLFATPDERPLTNPLRVMARSSHANLALLREMGEIKKCVTPVFIDNRKLDGFLEHYFQRDCRNSNCGVDCHYCESIAARAVTLDAERGRQCLSHVKRVSEMLENRGAFARDNPIARAVMALMRTLSSKRNNFMGGSRTLEPNTAVGGSRTLEPNTAVEGSRTLEPNTAVEGSRTLEPNTAVGGSRTLEPNTAFESPPHSVAKGA